MSKKSNNFSFPVLGILGLIFVTLKLAEIGVVATWSWWWVLAPFWLLPAVFLGGMGICALVVGCVKTFEKKGKK